MPQTPPERSAPAMDLFVEATDQRNRPLPVAGFKGTPEEIERQWYEQVYRGHGDSMAQLTWRAVLIGSCLGGVLSLTNLYIGLKAGWGFGVAITASILSYAIWTSLLKVGLARTPMTILENNCMQPAPPATPPAGPWSRPLRPTLLSITSRCLCRSCWPGCSSSPCSGSRWPSP